MAKIFLNLLSICFFINYSYSAKILGIFSGVSYSHQRLGSKLLYELAARGHEVTLILPEEFAPKHPIKNVKTIHLDFSIISEAPKPDIFNEPNRGTLSKIISLDLMGLFFTEVALNQTNIKTLLKSNEQFDLVIIEHFLNEAFKGFCYHYKAHCVVVSSMGASRFTNPQMGNPEFPSYVIDSTLTYTGTMNFFQRLINTFTYIFASLFFNFYTLPKQNELLHKYFPNMPDITELYYNSSLMLVNSHVSINPALPLVPNMIPIGGFHIDPPTQLPENLQKYLDDAKTGAIYFSMGSHITPHTMPNEKLKAIIKVLSKLQQKVLWKFDDNLPNKPENVMVSNWFPQQEVLAHPNVVLFISHGGLFSTIETIYHGKPLVGIPILDDQQVNIASAEAYGFARTVHFNELTEETLENALNEILHNPKYAENARKRSRILHDEPMKPQDKAVFWIEYVLKHDGAPELRTGALNLRWYQLICLDVLSFAVSLFFLTAYIFCRFCKIVVRFACRTAKKEVKMKSKKQETKKNR